MRVACSFTLLLAWAVLAGAAEPEGPFAHVDHAPLNLPCTYCHSGGEKGNLARFPTIETCRMCHTEIAERAFPEQARVYTIPDFIFFSHGDHFDGGASCQDCHGEVMQQAKIERARPTTMRACVGCHQEHEAATDCHLCHDLGQ